MARGIGWWREGECEGFGGESVIAVDDDKPKSVSFRCPEEKKRKLSGLISL